MQEVYVGRMLMSYTPTSAGYQLNGNLTQKVFPTAYARFKTAVEQGRMREAYGLFDTDAQTAPVPPQFEGLQRPLKINEKDGSLATPVQGDFGPVDTFGLVAKTTIGAIVPDVEHITGRVISIQQQPGRPPSFRYEQFFQSDWHGREMYPIDLIMHSLGNIHLEPNGNLELTLSTCEHWGIYVAGGIVGFSDIAHGDVSAIRREVHINRPDRDGLRSKSSPPRPSDPRFEIEFALSQTTRNYDLALLTAANIAAGIPVMNPMERALFSGYDTTRFRLRILQAAHGLGFALDIPRKNQAAHSRKHFERLWKSLPSDDLKRILAAHYNHATDQTLKIFQTIGE